MLPKSNDVQVIWETPEAEGGLIAKPRRLLAIGVPTYNRAHSLAPMLARLSVDIAGAIDNIEIIISDNCSTDSTQQVIRDWAKDLPQAWSVRAIVQRQNIGLSRNLVSLFYLADAQYFMFLGDDDRLADGALRKICRILEANSVSAIIQGVWGGRLRSPTTGLMGCMHAAHLFYEYGNAWAAVVQREAAINAIDARGLREEVEKIVWPQTVMGFLAMHDLKEVPIYATDFEIGQPLGEPLNLTNKAYWIRSLAGLLSAATMVDRATRTWTTRRAFVNVRSAGFVGHLRSIFWQSLVEESATSCKALCRQLRTDYGIRGKLWSLVFGIADSKAALEFLARVAFVARHRGGRRNFRDYLRQARERWQLNVANAAASKKRYGDWF